MAVYVSCPLSSRGVEVAAPIPNITVRWWVGQLARSLYRLQSDPVMLRRLYLAETTVELFAVLPTACAALFPRKVRAPTQDQPSRRLAASLRGPTELLLQPREHVPESVH